MASKPRFSSTIQLNDRKIRQDSQQISKSDIMFFNSARKLMTLQIHLENTQFRAAYRFKLEPLECEGRQEKQRLVLTKFRLTFGLFPLFSCSGYMYSVEPYVTVNGLVRMHQSVSGSRFQSGIPRIRRNCTITTEP